MNARQLTCRVNACGGYRKPVHNRSTEDDGRSFRHIGERFLNGEKCALRINRKNSIKLIFRCRSYWSGSIGSNPRIYEQSINPAKPLIHFTHQDFEVFPPPAISTESHPT